MEISYAYVSLERVNFTRFFFDSNCDIFLTSGFHSRVPTVGDPLCAFVLKANRTIALCSSGEQFQNLCSLTQYFYNNILFFVSDKGFYRTYFTFFLCSKVTTPERVTDSQRLFLNTQHLFITMIRSFLHVVRCNIFFKYETCGGKCHP